MICESDCKCIKNLIVKYLYLTEILTSEKFIWLCEFENTLRLVIKTNFAAPSFDMIQMRAQQVNCQKYNYKITLWG